jgi:cobalamin biosynthesis protein CobW
LLGIEAFAEDDLANRHSIHDHHHDHNHDHEHNNEITSEVIEYNQTDDIKVLVKELTELVNNNEIYRIKGFVNIPNKPMRMVIQGVGTRFDYYFDRKWNDDEERKTRLVVIGRNLALSNVVS